MMPGATAVAPVAIGRKPMMPADPWHPVIFAEKPGGFVDGKIGCLSLASQTGRSYPQEKTTSNIAG